MLWRSRYGIFDFDAYDPRRGAAAYVAHYVIKADTETVEWSFYTTNPNHGRNKYVPEPRCSGYELYTRGRDWEETEALTQVQGTKEDKQKVAVMHLFPLTGSGPDDTRALRR
jgi:hypothetical protein